MSQTVTVPTALQGSLALKVVTDGRRSFAASQRHEGALRIIRPHYLDDSGQVNYVIVNPGGGYLGGDRYQIDVDVARDASLLLTTQSATKIYRTEGARAHLRLDAKIGPGAVLEYLPDQLIAYRESRFRQLNYFSIDPEGTLITAEVVTPGWAPDGSLFGYHELSLRTEIKWGEELLLVDSMLLQPSQNSEANRNKGSDPGPSGGAGELEGFSHFGTLTVVDRRVDAELLGKLRLLVDDFPARTGISQLARPGLVLRSLAHSTEVLNELIGACVAECRRRWTGQGPVALRKH